MVRGMDRIVGGPGGPAGLERTRWGRVSSCEGGSGFLRFWWVRAFLFFRGVGVLAATWRTE